MVLAQQFPARPLVFAFSRSRHCRLDMGITQWINAEPGGLMVLQESLQNTLSVGRISQLHSYRPTRPNCRIYPLNYATRRSKKQRLCGLQYCLRLYNSASTSVMVVDQDNQESRSGGHKYPSVREQLEKLNIFCHSYEPGQYRRVLCPKCKGGSSQERSLAIFIRPNKDWAMWLCHRAKCGWTGNTQSTPMFGGSSAVKLDDKYFESDASNNGVKLIKNFTEESLRLEPISGEVCDYLAARQISIETLQRNGVMQTRRNNQTVIAFTYRKNGRIVNCKYRDTNKRFWQERHSEKILYGLDDIKEAKDIIIVEGEIDKLSMEEAGYQNCVSVPDGAPAKVSPKDLPPVEQDKKFEYLWNFKEYFEQASRIILATDADEPGQALAEELARRLGRERCWRVNWPRTSKNEICKDANEVLMLLGQQALREVIDTAELYPIRGLFRFSDYFDEIDGYYTCRLGNELGISTGWVGLDELYRVVPGELTIVTGVPNSGKSEWIDALMCNLNHREGWTFALCSMENMVREHGRKLLEKHIKKPFFHAKYGGSLPRMSIRELEEGKRWLNETFYLIRCEDDTLPSIKWVLNLAKAAVLRHGIRGLVIDPYNELDHQRSSNQTETEYVSQMLTKVKRFAQHHGCHVWFVAHPRQLQNWHGGAPSLYDISGSAHFINKCDNGIVVHRNRDPEAGPLDQVQILVRKVRNKVVGNIGDTFLSYNRATGEFADILIK